MSKLNKKPISRFSDSQLESLGKLKEEDGWSIISELARDVLKDAKLENVDKKLPANEYKLKCLAYLKAKEMFERVFKDLDSITDYSIKKKINYG